MFLGVGAALGLVASGCGGSGATTASAPTKAAFIRSADAICENADRKQKRGQIAFSEEHPGGISKRPVEENAVLTVGLPPVREEAEELGKLAAPRGDEAKIEAIVKGLGSAVKKAEAEPSVLLEENSSGPFAEVFKLAREYGFKACATPL
jgi:hypothetical protein